MNIFSWQNLHILYLLKLRDTGDMSPRYIWSNNVYRRVFSHCVFASFLFQHFMEYEMPGPAREFFSLYTTLILYRHSASILDRVCVIFSFFLFSFNVYLCVYKLAVVLCVMNYSKQQHQQQKKQVFDPLFFIHCLWALYIYTHRITQKEEKRKKDIPRLTLPLRAWTDSGMTRFLLSFHLLGL